METEVVTLDGPDAAKKIEFEELTLKYLDSLYGFALVLTGNSDDAHDLVQDAYLRAFRFYHRYEHIANYKAWLFTITKNLFINRYHQRAREVSLTELEIVEDDPYESPKEILVASSDRHQRGLFRQDFQRAMDSLPEKLRLAVLLKDVEGFDYKEIAEIMSCPLGTVMSRLSRGRNFLKKALKDYWGTRQASTSSAPHHAVA
ncbi:MAG: sigma-70 family RNA polymerase sigma factor [Nitrospirota bacterium]